MGMLLRMGRNKYWDWFSIVFLFPLFPYWDSNLNIVHSLPSIACRHLCRHWRTLCYSCAPSLSSFMLAHFMLYAPIFFFILCNLFCWRSHVSCVLSPSIARRTSQMLVVRVRDKKPKDQIQLNENIRRNPAGRRSIFWEARQDPSNLWQTGNHAPLCMVCWIDCRRSRYSFQQITTKNQQTKKNEKIFIHYQPKKPRRIRASKRR